MHLLRLQGMPILEQLQIEEALLKVDDRQYCIVNQGSPPAIVMGISGKPEKLIDLNKMQSQPVPVVRRFSGGGTVFIDPHTLFVTFICQGPVPSLQRSILAWTEQLYRPVFGNAFRVQDNDYVFGNYKFGGNAQYLRKNRWLHHTSFLWDYDPANMEYLHIPEKAPAYRCGRSHAEFLCTLKEHYADLEEVIERIITEVSIRFPLKPITLEEIAPIRALSHRSSTKILDL